MTKPPCDSLPEIGFEQVAKMPIAKSNDMILERCDTVYGAYLPLSSNGYL